MSSQQHVQYHTTRPNIHCLIVWLLHEDLWCNITKGTVGLSARLTRSKCLGQAEINEFNLRVFTFVDHEHVLWFQVPMRDSKRVHEVNCSGNLVENGTTSLLTYDELMIVKVREEIATFQ